MSETTTSRLPDKRSSYRKLVDSILGRKSPDHTRREFKGLQIVSECVIDFGPYTKSIGVKVKEPIVFHTESADKVQITYYGVTPISADADGNYVCTIEQFSHRTRVSK